MADSADLPCQQLVELVTAYLEGTLDPASRLRFESHIADCSGCAAYLEQYRETIAQLGALDTARLSPQSMTAMRRAFRDWAT